MSELVSPGVLRASGSSDDRFPDPFCDIASMAMPRDISDALRWSERLFQMNGIYREAVNRVVSYFLTDVEINDTDESNQRVGREEREKFQAFLHDTLGLKEVLHTVLMDYMCYGNSFTSILMPFRRYLHCGRKGCGHEAPLREIFTNSVYAFRWSGFEFHARCPQCRYQGKWERVDRRSADQAQIKVKRWNPHEIDILHDPYSDNSRYIWRIPDDYRNLVRKGHLHHLEHAPWEIVKAIKDNKNFEFEPGFIEHMKEDAPAGLKFRGWGLSRVIVNFRQAYYLALLMRVNEAIALDYTVPFRVIAPPPAARGGTAGAAGGSDPIYTVDLSRFRMHVQSMLRARRRDPARWNVLPFPIEYQALGGEAANLAPKELIEQAVDMLLTAIGIPVEMFRGTMSMQAAPAALRLFEANWGHLPQKANCFIGNVVRRVAALMSWEPVTAKLQRVTVADDLNRQMAILQLMMGNQISKTTGLARAVNLDYPAESKRMLEEERQVAEDTDKMQKEMDQSAQMTDMVNAPDMMRGVGDPGAAAGQAPAGGGGQAAPAGAPGQMPMVPPSATQQFIAQRVNQPNVKRSPEDMQAQAQTLATDLLAKPESQRRSELIRLKQVDRTIHALVRAIMDDMSRQAELQGRDMVLAQQLGKQAERRHTYIQL